MKKSKRLRTRIRIPKKHLVYIPEDLTPEDMQYWRYFLNRSINRKDKTVWLIDASLKEEVEKSLTQEVRRVQERAWEMVQWIFELQNGWIRKRTLTDYLWPEMLHGPRATLPDLRDTSKPNPAYEDQLNELKRALGRPPNWQELRRAGLNKNIRVPGKISICHTTQAGYSKLWISKSYPKNEQGHWIGAFESFLRDLTDDDLVQFWLEFKSSRQIQRELVRRAGNIHPTFPVEFKYSKLSRVGNAELRRALVGFCDIDWPDPIAVDDDGELIPYNTHIQVLRVTCPSTGRQYHLGVPVVAGRRTNWRGEVESEGTPLDTPRKARLWTLGLNPDELNQNGLNIELVQSIKLLEES